MNLADKRSVPTKRQHSRKRREADYAADRVLEQVRKLCLSLPESIEVDSWGHPNFRAGKRTFATFEWIHGRPSIAFRLAPTDADQLLGREEFFMTPYGQGRWISLWADGSLDWSLIGFLVEQSYRTVALKRMIAALDRTKHRPDSPKDR